MTERINKSREIKRANGDSSDSSNESEGRMTSEERRFREDQAEGRLRGFEKEARDLDSQFEGFWRGEYASVIKSLQSMMYAAKKIHELGGEEQMGKEQYDKYANHYNIVLDSVINAYNGMDRRRFRAGAEEYNARVLRYNGELERKSSSLHKQFKVSKYDIESKMPPEIDSLTLEEALEKKIWVQYERDYPSGLPRKPDDQLEWEISAGF